MKRTLDELLLVIVFPQQTSAAAPNQDQKKEIKVHKLLFLPSLGGDVVFVAIFGMYSGDYYSTS